MSRAAAFGIWAICMLCPTAGHAQNKTPAKIDPLSALVGGSGEEALAAKFRPILLASLPDPLYEDAKHWGKQRPGFNGQPRNDGRWWKVKVVGRELRDTLILDIRNLEQNKNLRTFTVYLSFDAAVLFDRQTWKSGIRLISSSTRARMRVRLNLDCELTTKVEKKGLLPDALIRLKVVRSDLKYDNLVVEHTAGIGGDGAKLLGSAMLETVKALKPNLERDLLAKANAAIVKAGDTKEIRISLMELLGGKKK